MNLDILWINLKLDCFANRQSKRPQLNGTAWVKKWKQLFEYQHLLLFRDIGWPKLLSIFKCCSYFQHQC